MRLGVVGGRNFRDRKLIFKHMNAWLKKYGTELHVVSGGCPDGPDKIAEDFCRQKGVSFTVHPAKWRDENDVLDKAAGFARNTIVVEDTDAMLAFWDFASNGTGDTLTKCRWRVPHRKLYVVNPLGRVFRGREVWGEEAGPEYEPEEAPPRIEIKHTSKPLTVERCREHPTTYYLFGDNLNQKGEAGQAVIRGEPNAVGIPTKVWPARSPVSYFNDKDFEYNTSRMVSALETVPDGSKVIVHLGIGSGRAQMPMKAPKTYAFLCNLLGMDNVFEKT